MFVTDNERSCKLLSRKGIETKIFSCSGNLSTDYEYDKANVFVLYSLKFSQRCTKVGKIV